VESLVGCVGEGREVMKGCLITLAVATSLVIAGVTYFSMGRVPGDDERCGVHCSLELMIRDEITGFNISRPESKIFDALGNRLLNPYLSLRTFKSIDRVDIAALGYEPLSVRPTRLGWQLRDIGHGGGRTYKYVFSVDVVIKLTPLTENDLPQLINLLENRDPKTSMFGKLKQLKNSNLRSETLASALRKRLFSVHSTLDYRDELLTGEILKEIIGPQAMNVEIFNQILKVTRDKGRAPWLRQTSYYLELLGTINPENESLHKEAMCQLAQDPREAEMVRSQAALRLGAASWKEVQVVGCPPYDGPAKDN